MARGQPVLGICQGAQQIAHLLGAHVGPPASGMNEFGHYELHPTEAGRDLIPEGLVVSQAHFHAFQVPAGAGRLASSALYENQAFRYGDSTYALQFHPEVTIEGLRRWRAAPWAAYGRPGAQTRQEQDALMIVHDRAQADWFYRFLEQSFPPLPEHWPRRGNCGGNVRFKGTRADLAHYCCQNGCPLVTEW